MNTKNRLIWTAAGLVLGGVAASAATVHAAAPDITVVKSAISAPGGEAVAKCPSGSKVIGGGYQGNGAFANGGTVYDMVEANTPTSDGQRWGAKFHSGRVVAYAICKPGAPIMVVKSATSAPGGEAVAKCPSGSKVIGGGYQGNGAFANGGTAYDMVEANTPTSDGQRWGAKFHSGRVVAYAICSTA
ncbi:hypothetical protein ELQ87_02510 [Streptomyces griseoviridis]|uniref:Secreted protein n=1 Tax=Streptomyces griseoviridis TaxID=45398 RepID=A0A3S9Z6A6_STRGD|nr:hypothetical protein [Streptomyces griseoviridis]AZS83291.1 hypothetical protein ELQ87_02510 [Streptomyces griseoviridis]QCN89854.1 hypothetical protein DDJ31_36850 [Streptomyces griseoviridis]